MFMRGEKSLEIFYVARIKKKYHAIGTSNNFAFEKWKHVVIKTMLGAIKYKFQNIVKNSRICKL